MSSPIANQDRQELDQHAPGDGQASFAETALKLGGKSDDEARRTGAIDKADDQVEALFAPQYQTTNSPVHRAVWDRGLPVELVQASPPVTPPEVQQVMDRSIEVVRRHRQAGTLMDAAGQDLGRDAQRPGGRPATGVCWSTSNTAGRERRSAALPHF